MPQTKSTTLSQPFAVAEPPPLNPGDFLSRVEFERRYQAHPEIKKAELIEGVVYMPSPVHFKQHGVPHSYIITWLGNCLASTPYLSLADNTTIRLDFENEPQPDAFLRLDPAVGGHSHISEDDYLEGPPELVVEIAASSAAYDLHAKRRVYARSGVPEYLAVQMYERRLDWFILREGVYDLLPVDEHGILRSEIFPGLWLSTSAFWNSDLAAMLKVLQEGLASPEHALFVAALQDKK
jgi:Uma2 family endonuclease